MGLWAGAGVEGIFGEDLKFYFGIKNPGKRLKFPYMLFPGKTVDSGLMPKKGGGGGGEHVDSFICVSETSLEKNFSL